MRLGYTALPASTGKRIAARRSLFPSRCGGRRALETSLYLPVKRFLEKLGFEVKGEVCGCDLVAIDGNEPTAVVVGELNLSPLGKPVEASGASIGAVGAMRQELVAAGDIAATGRHTLARARHHRISGDDAMPSYRIKNHRGDYLRREFTWYGRCKPYIWVSAKHRRRAESSTSPKQTE